MNLRIHPLVQYALLVAACLIWAGVAGIGLNGDDYQYLHSLAPMHGLADALRPWMSHDANPHYFRPLANTTMVIDFLLFGWSGSAFHLTNLLLHVITTLLVYRFSAQVFHLTDGQSLASAFLFALLASHEYNLVVDTARADILVAILAIAAMLALERWLRSADLKYLVLALLSYFFALASKESALFVLPVFAWQAVRQHGVNVRALSVSLLPFALVAAAFLVYHEHYTMTSLTSNDVVQGASAVGVAKNAFFSLGYLIIPLDQQTALSIASNPIVLVLLAIVAIGAIWIAIRSLDTSVRERMMLPIFFALCTGVPSSLVFERWRLFLPSVGAVAVIALIVTAMLRRGAGARVIGLSLACVFTLFHVYRSIAATGEWQRSTELMQSVKHDMVRILDVEQRRPSRLMLITSPAKLGSAGVLILGAEALGQQAEAERTNAPDLRYGFVDTNAVKVDEAIDLYALSKDNGFVGLTVTPLGRSVYRVAVPRRSGIRLVPAGLAMNALRRDFSLSTGDTIGNIIVRSYERTNATEWIEFVLRDTLNTPVVFDGRHLRLPSPIANP